MTLLASFCAATLVLCAPPAGTPPPAGQEASYAWYRAQYPDPSIFTAIGPAADPAETGVSPRGQLMMGKLAYSEVDGTVPGTPYVENALVFGIVEHDRFVTVGGERPATQSVVGDFLPIVLTHWKHDDVSLLETAFARPLRGNDYTSGLEATLAWATFEIGSPAAGPKKPFQNPGKPHENPISPAPFEMASKEIAVAAAFMGDEKNPRRKLSYREGVVFEGTSALGVVKLPAGFRCEFKEVLGPVIPGEPANGSVETLKKGGIYNALVVRGTCRPGEKVLVSFGRVFQFPGTRHWGPSPVEVTAEELMRRSPVEDLQKARQAWEKLAEPIAPRLVTPEVTLNRIVTRAMLDGYFLTKRWQQRYIAFDSVCYRCQWDDSSAKWIYALDLMGDHATATRLLDTIFSRQGQRKPKGTASAEGCFSDVTNIKSDGSDASWASCNGWALWCMAEHARLSDDRPWLAAHKQKLLDGANWIRRERRRSLDKPDDPCRGLIFGKFVCDMPDDGQVRGVGHFTYTDAISYLGLKETGQILADWGHAEGRELLEEAELYRRDILAAIDRATDKSSNPWCIPWALDAPKVEHPYLNGVCGPINLVYAGVVPLSDERVGHIIRWNVDHTHGGSFETSATRSMFYSQDLACVLMEQGRVEEFLRMFYTILASNVTHQTLSTCEWRTNTQPQLHSIASLIRMVRTMLVQERQGQVYLLQGTPRQWLEDGQRIDIHEAPTHYGSLSLSCISRVKEGRVEIDLVAPPRLADTPLKLRLRLPGGLRIADVKLEGKATHQVEGEWIELRKAQGAIRLKIQTTATARDNAQ